MFSEQEEDIAALRVGVIGIGNIGIDLQEIFFRNCKEIADYHHYIQRRRSR